MYKNMDTLKAGCQRCKRCPLCETRTRVVFGEGSYQADIMFVGEAPGAQEDIEGRPFIGRSGKLMDKMLEEAGLDREEIFITSLLKCRPPENRDPLPTEQALCEKWLAEQIRLIAPKVVVCIGRISAIRLIRGDYKVTKEHGVFYEKNGRVYMGMYHPAAVLRSPSLKAAAQEDYHKLKEFLEQGPHSGLYSNR